MGDTICLHQFYEIKSVCMSVGGVTHTAKPSIVPAKTPINSMHMAVTISEEF